MLLSCPNLAASGGNEGGSGSQGGSSSDGIGEQLGFFAKAIADALNAAENSTNAQDIFAALRTYREWLGARVAVRLDLGGDTYIGTNLARGNEAIAGTWDEFVQHAEGDAFSRALTSGTNYEGDSATLYVSKLGGGGPCRLICRPSIPSVARQMGISDLTVITPEGLFGTWTPEAGWTIAP